VYVQVVLINGNSQAVILNESEESKKNESEESKKIDPSLCTQDDKLA